jgi:multidrug efflux system outer membrane protein
MNARVPRHIGQLRLAAVLLALGPAGCAVGPDYQSPELNTPPAFRSQAGAAAADSLADRAWWEVFNDPALQALINEALANNQSLEAAVARVEAARALVGVARSEGMPQLNYNAAAGEETTYALTADTVDSIDYSIGGAVLSAAWELDIWGRVRRSTEAARANLLAQEYVRRGVMLTVTTDIAAGYFQLLRLDRELEVARESERAYSETVNLFTDRFELGRDSRLPVERAQAAYSSSTARIAELRRLIEQQENALSVLVGDNPRAIMRGLPLGSQTMPETPVGLTTDLLKRRPDILQAEQEMIAANAEIGVAVANFFPRIGLSALVGEQSIELGDIDGDFDVSNVFGVISGPIFTGGRLGSIYNARRAFWDESIAQYRGTVLVAFEETSNALVAQRTLADQRIAQERQVQALRQSVEFALLRYRSGRSSYFEVLEAQQQLYPAEYALAQTQQSQLVAVVNLYKALGGGWNLPTEQWPVTQ